MRVWKFLITGMLLLTCGCALLDNVNNSLNYVNESMEYINEVGQFAEQLPQLAEQAVNDATARRDLQTELETMKAKIEQFNELEAPQIAQDIHEQILAQNEKFLAGIDAYLTNIKNDIYDLSILQDTGIMNAIEQVLNLRESINQINQ